MIHEPPRPSAELRTRTLAELADICARLRSEGKRIVHCHGAFDLLHPGHILHFQAAKRLGDVLVVTLTEDRFIRKGPGRPAFNERLRCQTIAALADVDYVATSPWPTGVETIELLKPHFYVKGQDYRDRGQDPTGAILLEERTVRMHGGQMVCTDEPQFSSTQLLNAHFRSLGDVQRDYLTRIKRQFSVDEVINALRGLKSLRVLVVGEAILDEYHYCLPDSMSNKSPTISARFESAELYAGGVVAVANLLSGFCDHVSLIAGTGASNESEVDPIQAQLHPAVRVRTIARPDGPTVRKRRFLHRFHHQKLFEVTFLNDRPIPDETQSRFLEAIDDQAAESDVVLVLDFGHGLLTPRAVERLQARSRFLAVNAQINSSNRGYNSVRKYRGAHYVSVDEHELRLPFGDRFGPLDDLLRALEREVSCSRINVTLGTEGAYYYDGSRFHRAPVLIDSVVDSIGAGDAFMALTSLLVHRDVHPGMVPFVGNCVGGLTAQIVGHRTCVDPVDLYRFVGTLFKSVP